jgi:hypothetical protein
MPGKYFNQNGSSLKKLILSSKIYKIVHYKNDLGKICNNYIKN